MKNYILLSILLLLSFNVLAQITVRNESYLFVKDEIIFVNDEVNLTEAQSKIYLRDEAQLVQGNGTIGNTGLGELSVYQNGTTHNYAYNFWCAPIGNNSVSAGNESFMLGMINDATGLTSSATAAFTSYNGVSSPLTIATYWVYTFESSLEYSDWVYKGNTGAVAPGLGFTMKGTTGSGNSQLYDFRGKPNNGTISQNVSESNWTLIGNPYPSAIDALSFIHDSDNTAAITGVLYYWEQDLSVLSHNVADYVGGYASYTINALGTLETFIPATFATYSSDGTINNTGSTSTSDKRARRYIPIGQGFMVEGSSGTSGTVYAKNSHRVYYKETNVDSEFFRPANDNDLIIIENNQENTTTENYKVIPEEYKRFRLNIDFNDEYSRQLVQTFHDTEATDGFDRGFEIKSPLGVSNDAYWSIDNEPYIAQALSFNEYVMIPLYIKLEQNSAVRVRILDVQHFDDAQEIYVYDEENNTYTNIRNTSFEITLPQGVYSDRFKITFQNNNTLGLGDDTISGLTVYQNNNENKIVLLNPSKKDIQSVYLYDMTGREVWKKDITSIHPKYIFSTLTLNNGVYIIKIKLRNTDQQKQFKKKLVIAN